jgi:hypothetical protein
MKKSTRSRKLHLDHRTVRRLTETELHAAGAALWTMLDCPESGPTSIIILKPFPNTDWC